MTTPTIISATREDDNIFRITYHYKDHSNVLRFSADEIGWEKVLNDIVNFEEGGEK